MPHMSSSENVLIILWRGFVTSEVVFFCPTHFAMFFFCVKFIKGHLHGYLNGYEYFSVIYTSKFQFQFSSHSTNIQIVYFGVYI